MYPVDMLRIGGKRPNGRSTPNEPKKFAPSHLANPQSLGAARLLKQLTLALRDSSCEAIQH